MFLGGGLKHFLFIPLPGEMIKNYYDFSKGLKSPTRFFPGNLILKVRHILDSILELADVPWRSSPKSAGKTGKNPLKNQWDFGALCFSQELVQAV